jgi:hypothetical protein
VNVLHFPPGYRRITEPAGHGDLPGGDGAAGEFADWIAPNLSC